MDTCRTFHNPIFWQMSLSRTTYKNYTIDKNTKKKGNEKLKTWLLWYPSCEEGEHKMSLCMSVWFGIDVNYFVRIHMSKLKKEHTTSFQRAPGNNVQPTSTSWATSANSGANLLSLPRTSEKRRRTPQRKEWSIAKIQSVVIKEPDAFQHRWCFSERRSNERCDSLGDGEMEQPRRRQAHTATLRHIHVLRDNEAFVRPATVYGCALWRSNLESAIKKVMIPWKRGNERSVRLGVREIIITLCLLPMEGRL